MPCTRGLLLLAGLLVGGTASMRAGYVTAAEGAAAAGRVTQPAPGDAAQLVLGVAGLGLLGIGAWSCAVALVAAADLVRRRPLTHRGPLRPAWVRSAVLGCAPALGAAVLCTAAPVAADAGDQGARASGFSRLTGLALPTRPVTTTPAPRRQPARTVVRVVRPGECLWSISADLLGGRPRPDHVDAAWRQLYRANQERIGGDPDVVLPGTRLVVPPTLVQHLHPSR